MHALYATKLGKELCVRSELNEQKAKLLRKIKVCNQKIEMYTKKVVEYETEKLNSLKQNLK